jgi:large subunit ribosomal protein L2
MKLIKYKPTSNSLRHKASLKYNLLCKNNKLIKSLLIGKKNFSGRSSVTGRITVRHKGAGVKKNFRVIDIVNQSYYAISLGVAYDPNRNIFISLNFNIVENHFFYSPAINKIGAGAILVCAKEVEEVRVGYRLPLASIPVGSLISYLSFGSKAKFIKAAGAYGQLIEKSYLQCKVKLPSGTLISLLPSAYATIGVLSNLNHNKIVIGKAGTNRLKGIRPSVRGIAMNPVDHPHGGRSNGGCAAMTPWGKLTRGRKTKKI